MIVGANAATATALEAIASEPEPASVDWKSGQIDIPVEVIPMDDDERDKKRGARAASRLTMPGVVSSSMLTRRQEETSAQTRREPAAVEAPGCGQ